MIRKLIALAVAVSLPALGLLLAQPNQGRQFAFLVACGDYDKTQLNPVAFTVPEMTAFRQVLIDSGTPDKNIVFLHDNAKPFRFQPTREHILKELSLLMERLRPEDSVIVALSGHGVQFAGEKYGYFCPLNANLAKKETLLPMEGDDGLLKLLDQGKAGKKLLIVNACRNKPASNANLAAERLQLRDDYNEEAPKGTVMLLACSKNQFSWFYDDKEKRTERRNRSLFMYHLTEAWKGSYAKGKKVTVDHIVAEVTERVEADANPDFGHNQIPTVKRKFDGQWEVASAVAAVAKQIEVKTASRAKITEVSVTTWKHEIVEGKIPVLVIFTTDSDVPSRLYLPTIQALADRYHGKINVCNFVVSENKTFNFEKAKKLNDAYGIQIPAVPHVLIFKDGKLLPDISGRPPEVDLSRAIDRILQGK